MNCHEPHTQLHSAPNAAPNAGASKHVVFVHAHPDDEAVWTGATIAKLVQQGHRVTVITATLGEQGEVIGTPLAGLVADQADQLGGYRIAELRASLQALGANAPDHEPLLLGGAGCWRDSGMAGDPSNDDPHSFIHSGVKARQQLSELLDQLAPDLVITYDADGGYGHPDHIRCHELVAEVCGDLPTCGAVPTLWAVSDRESTRRGLAAITVVPKQWKQITVDELATVDASGAVNGGSSSGAASTNADGEFFSVTATPAEIAAKRDALRAHATQVWLGDGSVSATNPEAAFGQVDDSGDAWGVWAFSNLLCQPLLAHEWYRLGSATAEQVQWLREPGAKRQTVRKQVR